LAIGTTSTADSAAPARYRGRFAPSPSGPLHFGSLVAAVGSYLDARAHDGLWLVRLEDLDTPRVKPGAADEILRMLDRLGLQWDGPVWRQSQRHEAYEDALNRLDASQLLRACPCSRSALAALPRNRARTDEGGEELYHPPECLPGAPGRELGFAVRFRVRPGAVTITDRSVGPRTCDPAETIGDFVLKRRDGIVAYQLAVVVDDAAQGISDVVRGCDLLASTPRQLLLQQALALPQPTYLHLPLAVDGRGRKLSKSEDAPAVAGQSPAGQLVAVLHFLGQQPPARLGEAPLAEVWEWARRHWRPAGFAGRTTGRATWGPDFRIPLRK
jgi:glutamyl-Q tRNA(Asp) synthetase